eukprot:311889-Pleurochrysis_carterae.AAC.1
MHAFRRMSQIFRLVSTEPEAKNSPYGCHCGHGAEEGLGKKRDSGTGGEGWRRSGDDALAVMTLMALRSGVAETGVKAVAETRGDSGSGGVRINGGVSGVGPAKSYFRASYLRKQVELKGLRIVAGRPKDCYWKA